MDIFLIILTVILAIVLLAASIYMMIYFLDPSEKGFADSWWCKILLVLFTQIFGYMLAWAQLLVLPLDVSNTAGQGGELRIDVLWQIIYMLVFLFIVVFFPTAMFFYESDDTESCGRRLCWTFKHMICLFIVVGLILGIMFALLAYATIPVRAYVCPVPASFLASDDPSMISTCVSSDSSLEVPVSFPIYVMAMMSWVGWWLLVIYGGIGLSAIPMDLINKYRFRPTPLTVSELAAKKSGLKRRAKELLQDGQRLKEGKLTVEAETSWFKRRSQKNQQRRDENRLRAEVLLLERDFAVYREEEQISKVNPLLYPFYCLLGMFLLVVTIVWLLHILLFLMIRDEYGVPASSFLNEILVGLQQPGASWVCTAVYVLLTVYLLWACIKGNLKFGMRFFCCFQAHPMVKDETPMHSMMFNVSLILICSVSVTLFAVKAFSLYTRLTDISVMFGVQVQYLEFFKYFYQNQVFEIMLFCWTILVAIYLAFFKCRDAPRKPPSADIDLEFKRERLQIDAKADNKV
jgi:LMBR1 domain-containing protein 1